MRTCCSRIPAIIAVFALVAAGCGDQHRGAVAITETRPAGAAVDASTNATTADRLLPRKPAAMPHDHPPVDGTGVAPEAASGTKSPLAWNVPAGWTVGAARPMRLITFNSGTDGRVECSLTELSGTGGGAEANLNRWRGQFGQPPLAAGELASLPTIRMLEQDAPLIEISGTYSGMGGTPQADSKLLGSLAATAGRIFFVKMVGPSADVEAQRAAFVALCESLRVP